jgi:nicotinamidase-related amidase
VSRTATLIIDMLNPYDHEDGEPLAEHARDRIEPLKALIDATIEAEDAELVYVNDNFDDFTATSQDLAEAAMQGEHPELIEPILPPEGALFVQKVRHSAFYESGLNHLLNVKDIDTVVLAGQVTEQCVLYTALDAYIRGFDIRVARDACVHLDEEFGGAALRMMEENMKAELVGVADALSDADA